jgi:hypothetical protein
MSVPTTLLSLQVWPTMTFSLKLPLVPSYTSRYSKGGGGAAAAVLANQTLATIVRCLKLAGNFPDRAVSEIKRRPMSTSTNLSNLRAKGCTAYVYQPGEIRPKKHSPRARKSTLIGYNSSQNSK